MFLTQKQKALMIFGHFDPQMGPNIDGEGSGKVNLNIEKTRFTNYWGLNTEIFNFVLGCTVLYLKLKKQLIHNLP